MSRGEAGSAPDSSTIRDAYTTEYFLADCGGHETWRDSGGKVLDPRLDCMARLAALHPTPRRVLDLGCGRGELARYFAAHGCQVDAVDYSPAAIDLATTTLQDAPYLRDRVWLRCESVTEDRTYRGGYDLVIASDVIEHLAPHELDAMYRRVARHLQPDGLFLVHTFPNQWYYRFGYPRRRRRAAARGEHLPAEPRSDYELHMHINEQSPPVLGRQLRAHFPHVLLWAGDHQNPEGSLAGSFTREDWRQAPSLFAVAGHWRPEPVRVRAALQSTAPDPGPSPGPASGTDPGPCPVPPPGWLRRGYRRLRGQRRLGWPLRLLDGLRQLPRLATRLQQLDARYSELQARLDHHSRARPTPGADGEGGADATDPRLERWYQAFEEHFRGPAATIRERLRVYLPHIASAPVDSAHPWLDLGCGRGDWLELLVGEGYAAYGVDTHPEAIARARARGLDARPEPALDHLWSLPEGSLGAVSALHLLEHLPFARTLELLDATRRVLVPGGIFLFETPNPENLAVGACHFHTDPTHCQPLLPRVMEHTLEHAGFIDVQIMRLNPDDDVALQWPAEANPRGVPEVVELRERFNAMFYGPRDFAIRARQPGGQSPASIP